MQVTVFEDDYVSVAVPYWHRGEAALQVFRNIRRLGQTLERRFGMTTFDGQLGREVDWRRDEGVIVRMLDETAGSMAEIGRARGGGKRWWEFWK